MWAQFEPKFVHLKDVAGSVALQELDQFQHVCGVRVFIQDLLHHALWVQGAQLAP